MDAVKFIKEHYRLCTNHKGCRDCPVYVEGLSDCGFETNNPEKLVELVELWSKAHPPKTMLQDFLEKYPDAPLDADDGRPLTCPYKLGYSRNPKCDNAFSYSCVDCWNRPVNG